MLYLILNFKNPFFFIYSIYLLIKGILWPLKKHFPNRGNNFYSNRYKVSGSDLKFSPIIDRLIQLGIDIKIGHHQKNLEDAEIIVISSAVGSKNIELIEAKRKKFQ